MVSSAHFLATIEEAVHRQGLSRVALLVGVSGGADSLALLHALARLSEDKRPRLRVAHVDHCLRGESPEDARFVCEIAASLAIPCSIGRLDVRKLAAERATGLEEAARYARLKFFADLATSTGALAVALGHTRDDQNETRLLHLIRGSGLRGLVGMTEDTALDVDGERLRLFRPLLALARSDTEAYCRANGLSPRVDITNQDVAFSRNRVRHEVLPGMRHLNPRVDLALERLGRAAADTETFVEDELDRRLPDLVVVQGARWLIRRDRFRALPAALKRALVRRAAMPGGVTIGSEAVETAIEAAEHWPAGTRLDWPGGRFVHIEHDWLSIGPQSAALPPEPVDGTVALSGSPNELPIRLPRSVRSSERPERATLRVRRQQKRCLSRLGDRWHTDLDARQLADSLVLRSRRPGDRLAPEGLAGTKKLQDVLVDAHIPRAERDGVPLLGTGDRIAWVVGLRRSREFLAGPDAQEVVCCEVVDRGG